MLKPCYRRSCARPTVRALMLTAFKRDGHLLLRRVPVFRSSHCFLSSLSVVLYRPFKQIIIIKMDFNSAHIHLSPKNSHPICILPVY